jgi:transcription elongation factor GreA
MKGMAMVRDRVVHLTPEGRQRLSEELRVLRTEKLPELTARIQDANEHGDISDNSEYEELKEELVLTDARIHELEFLLDKAEDIEPPAEGRVGLGSTVTLRSDDGEEESWRLVSPEEADTRAGAISTDSPVGHALIDRQVGDTTSVETPGGTITYTILSVR